MLNCGWLCKLEWHRDSVGTQLMSKACCVRRFKQSRSELPVNFNGTAEHAIREVIEFYRRNFYFRSGDCHSVGLLLRSD